MNWSRLPLYVTAGILAEVRELLARKKIRSKFPHRTLDRVDLFLQKITTFAVLVNEIPDAGVMIRDPDDLPHHNLALAANVGFIVSRDKDLLDLMKDEAFAAKHPQLQIVDPAAFLAAVRPTTK